MTNNEIPSTTWLEDEAKKLTSAPTYEQLPSLKLTPNVVTEITIDFSKPFETWDGDDAHGQPITKKIIPVTSNGTKMNFWLNVKNPLWREIVNGGKAGQTVFKILQTGQREATKYVLVK